MQACHGTLPRLGYGYLDPEKYPTKRNPAAALAADEQEKRTC
jgi:hypothetical protein